MSWLFIKRIRITKNRTLHVINFDSQLKLIVVNKYQYQSVSGHLKSIKVHHKILCDYRFLSKLVLECNFFPKTIGRQKGSEATVSTVSKSLRSLWKVLHHIKLDEWLFWKSTWADAAFVWTAFISFCNEYYPCAFEELRRPNPSPYAALTSSLHRSTTDILSSGLKSLLKLITCPEITVIFYSYRQI